MSPSDKTFVKLPLFPLDTVLFPHSQIPLHIFEERYKKLITDCLQYSSSFGINVIFEQQIRTIGCTARIVEITKHYANGSFDVVVEGERRYILNEVEEKSMPYFIGTVQWFADESGDTDENLLHTAIDLYNKFVEIVYPLLVPTITADKYSAIDSFFLSQKAGMDLLQRHIVLSLNSEVRRLQFLVQHFEATLPLLASKKKVEEFAKQDGYLQTKRA